LGLHEQTGGTHSYPYVCEITAGDRAPEKIWTDLMECLAEYSPNPQVEMRLVGYKSQAFSATGEVSSSSRQQLTDVPLTLLCAIYAAEGLTKDANLRNVTLRHGSRCHFVDMHAVLEQRVPGNGDMVRIAREQIKKAYLLGQTVKPSAIHLTRKNITLTQALTCVGGMREDQADARDIVIFGDEPIGMTVYQLNEPKHRCLPDRHTFRELAAGCDPCDHIADASLETADLDPAADDPHARPVTRRLRKR
jgi:polysaccharide export outer membrane protein